jgi:hypothetical protein
MKPNATSNGTDVVLAQWDEWLGRATDRLMDLDARASGAVADVRMDVAAAFVCRKAIAARVEAMRTAGNSANEVAQQPLVDDQGQLIGSNLESAAALLAAVLDRVDSTIGADEETAGRIATDSIAAATDIAAAERLAVQLGQYVQRVAAARAQLDAAGRLPRALHDAAVAGASLRQELESMAADRDQMFAQWATVSETIQQYATREVEVRAIVERCREKVTPLPNIAVPSVQALGAVDSVDQLRDMPWPAARAIMQPMLTRLDRLDDAFDQVQRRFTDVLSQRDDLRGLLQAFRDKAAGSGLAEHADLEPLFRDAERELWSAPCDVVRAKTMVDRYTAAVNQMIDDGRRGAR